MHASFTSPRGAAMLANLTPFLIHWATLALGLWVCSHVFKICSNDVYRNFAIITGDNGSLSVGFFLVLVDDISTTTQKSGSDE